MNEAMTPRHRYQNDVMYHNLVDTLLNVIIECHLTPSEVREAAVLACILYEEKRTEPPLFNLEGNIFTPGT